MSSTTDLNDELRAARVRLSRMRQAVEELDRRVEALERRQRDADPRDKAAIGTEIRVATEHRLSAIELLAEAEAQVAEREERFGEAVSTAKKQLGATAQACSEAARRFDQAMREAAAAVVELEGAADPIRPFLANGIGSYTHMRHITAAFRHAFAERLSSAERMAERQSMSDRIGTMIADARHNSARHGNRRAA